MYPHYQLMKTLHDERLRAAARDHLAAKARRARAAGRDHAAATRAGATARGAATMPRKQGAIIGLGIPLGAILLFPQGIIPAVLKLAHARGRIWFLPLYLPKPLQWPACFVMIILGVAVYCYVLWTMRQLKKSTRELHAGKGGSRSPKSALTRIRTGQNLRAAPPVMPPPRTRRTLRSASLGVSPSDPPWPRNPAATCAPRPWTALTPKCPPDQRPRTRVTRPSQTRKSIISNGPCPPPPPSPVSSPAEAPVPPRSRGTSPTRPPKSSNQPITAPCPRRLPARARGLRVSARVCHHSGIELAEAMRDGCLLFGGHSDLPAGGHKEDLMAITERDPICKSTHRHAAPNTE